MEFVEFMQQASHVKGEFSKRDVSKKLICRYPRGHARKNSVANF
jgi:hypothetical protein